MEWDRDSARRGPHLDWDEQHFAKGQIFLAGLGVASTNRRGVLPSQHATDRGRLPLLTRPAPARNRHWLGLPAPKSRPNPATGPSRRPSWPRDGQGRARRSRGTSRRRAYYGRPGDLPWKWGRFGSSESGSESPTPRPGLPDPADTIRAGQAPPQVGPTGQITGSEQSRKRVGARHVFFTASSGWGLCFVAAQ